jgi:hypothetical protein
MQTDSRSNRHQARSPSTRTPLGYGDDDGRIYGGNKVKLTRKLADILIAIVKERRRLRRNRKISKAMHRAHARRQKMMLPEYKERQKALFEILNGIKRPSTRTKNEQNR